MAKGRRNAASASAYSRTPASIAEVKRRRIESKHSTETDEGDGASITQAEG